MDPSFFIGYALKSTTLLAAAGLIAFALRRSSAAVRHLVWTAAFAGVLALPLLSVSLPALRAPVAQRLVLPPVLFQATATAKSAPDLASNVPSRTRVNPGMQFDWQRALLGLWLLGVAAFLIRMTAGYLAILRLRRRARPSADCTPDVKILETGPGTMPMTFGVFKPVILMPTDTSTWTPERRQIVLQHELAHVHRGDAATHLIARTALSLLWWNPLAWMAWREFLKERERAADDLVLQCGAPAANYAEHLLEIARTLRTPVAHAAIAMARRSDLEGRIVSILDPQKDRRPAGRVRAGVALLAAIACISPLAALQAPDVEATIQSANAEKNFDSLDRTAATARSAGKYDVARKLLDASLQLRGKLYGEQSVEYGVGLLNLGDLESSRRQKDPAIAFYQRALEVLGNKPESVRALTHLGFAAMGRKNYDEARQLFERVQIADPSKAAESAMWQAVALDREGQIEKADAMFKQAVNAADPNSANAATIMHLYALFLLANGQNGDSNEMDARSTMIRNALKPAVHATAGAYKIGGGITPPSIATKVEPEYSDEARAAKLAGTVALYVEIGPDGSPRNVTVTRGLGLGLDQKAVEAIRQWKFKPGAKDGQPVTVMATIEVNFRLF